MNPLALIFVLIAIVALMAVPRRFAPLPLLLTVCYMTRGQGIDIGPFSFTVIRILLLAGFIRAMFRREWLVGGIIKLDALMLVWCVWLAISSVFHEDPREALIFRLGLAFNYVGTYFLIRIFCSEPEDIRRLVVFTAFLLAPIAIEMFNEQVTAKNLFSFFGGVPETPQFRKGRYRAQGPFAHPILAGTVAAACFPLMIMIWRENRRAAIIGMVSCGVMLITCASSGPILSAGAAAFGVGMWKYRDKVKFMRWSAPFVYVLLSLVRETPPYYIMAEIDIAGGSTGWFRARLIESSIEHLNEWWVGGTDYTRHWMPSGVSWSPDHTDITNFYLKMGVWGGLPLMIIFILILLVAFHYIGVVVKRLEQTSKAEAFAVWCLGASLFSHAATSISVSYFDQSFVFYFLCIAAAGSLRFADQRNPVAHRAPRARTPRRWSPNRRVPRPTW